MIATMILDKQMSRPVAPTKTDDTILELNNVTRTFGAFKAVRGVSLKIRRGEFVTLLGPSGCGKSTILRMIAGFETPNSSTIRMNGADISKKRPFERAVGLVFQNLALFPHLNVFDNVAFGLRAHGVGKAEISDKVMAMLGLVDLADFAHRPVGRISGGQRQRVALARSLVTEPDVLLLDEPLSALDLKLRRQLQTELKTIQQKTGITFIFVTHDQEEALSMSDRIAVMNAGLVEQFSPAVETYHFPQTEFVARFVGETNLFHGRLATDDGGKRVLRFDDPPFEMALPENLPEDLPEDPPEFAPGQAVALSVRPEHVRIEAADGAGDCVRHTGQVVSHSFSGASLTYTIRTGGRDVLAQAVFRPGGRHPLPVGEAVTIGWDMDQVRLIPASPQRQEH